MTLGFEKVQKRGPNVVNASHNFPSRHLTCRLELCWQIYRQPWPQRQVACGMDCRGWGGVANPHNVKLENHSM